MGNWDITNRLSLSLNNGYSLSLIQESKTTRIEVALIDPDGDIESYSSKPFELPEQVHQHLDAQDLITAISRAEIHVTQRSNKDVCY